MQIAVTSDVHYGHPRVKLDFVKAIRDNVFKFGHPDAFFIAGDLGESREDVDTALDILSTACERKVYIPGNHDIWRDMGYDSQDLLYRALPQCAEKHGFQWLEGRIDLGAVSIIYTPAWHDMSLRMPYWPRHWSDRDFSTEYFENFSDGKRLSIDPKKLFADQFDAFTKNLFGVPDDVEALMIVSHYPIFAESYRPYSLNPLYSINDNHRMTIEKCQLSDAFFYSPRFGEAAKLFHSKRPDLKILSVSGHTHTHFDMIVAPGIRAFNSSADYGKPTIIMAYWDDGGSSWSVYEGMAVQRKTAKWTD